MTIQPHTTGERRVRGVDLAWERRGTGPPLVWGHGLSSSRASEDAGGLIDFDRLANTTDVIRYDARGHGASGFTADAAAYAWDQMAQDQMALCDALDIPRAIVGGASLGAATALHVAAAEPDRVSALVLVIPPTAWETRAAQTQLYESMADIVERRGVEPLVDAIVATPPPDPLAGRTEWIDRLVAALRAADPVRLAGIYRGATTADLPSREAVAAIDVPALILAWTGDAGHPVSSVTELSQLLPHAESVVSSTWDELQTWTDRIVQFVS